MKTKLQEKNLRQIIDSSFDAFIGIDHHGTIFEWNKQAENIFGWNAKDAIGKHIHEVMSPANASEDIFLALVDTQVSNRRIQLDAVRKNGERFPTEISITQIPNATRHETYLFIHDISNRKNEELKLYQLASNDNLTGLKNRAYFNASLSDAMARCRRNHTHLALIFLDIDHFKSINDNLGHEAGDNLLIEFANRLRRALRETDILSRLGGDEFTIIAEGIVDDAGAIKIATHILQALNSEEWLGLPAVKITSSIGVAIYDGRQIEAKNLIALADKAMYKAKHSGRNNFKLLKFEDVESSVETHQSLADVASIQHAQQLLSVTKHTDAHFIQHTLSALRRHLDMDVAFISHFHDGLREFEYVDAKALNPPIAVGDSGLLEDSYCQRVIDGRLPEIINDAFEIPEAMSLPVTQIVPVRAHMSVPIKMQNGDIYGTFCCFSYHADQTLNERDISVMHVFADLVAQQLRTQTGHSEIKSA